MHRITPDALDKAKLDKQQQAILIKDLKITLDKKTFNLSFSAPLRIEGMEGNKDIVLKLQKTELDQRMNPPVVVPDGH